MINTNFKLNFLPELIAYIWCYTFLETQSFEHFAIIRAQELVRKKTEVKVERSGQVYFVSSSVRSWVPPLNTQCLGN